MKKALAVLILAALITSFAACTGPKDGPGDPTQAPQTTQIHGETESPSEPDATEEQAVPEEPVVFADARFENAVRNQLKVYMGDPLTKGRLAGVTSIDLSGMALTDISDVKWFTGLKKLVLSGNKIEDISPLGELKTLETLELSGCGISDLSGLSGLSGLKTLNLASNPITDLSPLSGLTSLETLDLEAYKAEPLDITPLAGLKNLKKLVVQTDDLSPLAGLANMRELNVTGNFTDLDALSGMTELKTLYIYAGWDSWTERTYRHLDITGLAPLTELHQLFIQFAEVDDIGPLSGMSSLFHLALIDVNIKDLTPISELEKLNDLFLTGNGIEDVTPLYGMTSLVEVHIQDNPLTLEQIDELRKHLPGCYVGFDNH